MRLFLALLAACPLAACSCSEESTAIGPHLYYSRPTVVVARALDHDAGPGERPRVYRFRVIENLKGGPTAGMEIFVFAGIDGMCNVNFELSQNYLLYPAEPHPHMSIFGGTPGWPRRPLPAAWKGRERLRLYATAGCNPTKRIANSQADPDLRDLRARRNPAAPRTSP